MTQAEAIAARLTATPHCEACREMREQAAFRLMQLEARIAEALAFCEDREDIRDGEFGPRPNDFMHLATILKGRQA